MAPSSVSAYLSEGFEDRLALGARHHAIRDPHGDLPLAVDDVLHAPRMTRQQRSRSSRRSKRCSSAGKSISPMDRAT